MVVNIKPWVLKNGEKCFLRRKEIQFRRSRWLWEVLARKRFTEENYSTRGGGSLMIWVGVFSSSGKLKLQFFSGRQKAADYVKMLNDLSLTQEERRLCWEEWINNEDLLAWTKNKISWPYSFLTHPNTISEWSLSFFLSSFIFSLFPTLFQN